MKTNKQTWKEVSISGVTGILMGAGSMKAVQSKEVEEIAVDSEEASAEINYDDMSFGDAFNSARAELGAGGVFRWHGNLYNTYTAEEWNAKSSEEQYAFAEEVGAEISADDVDTSDLTQVEDADVRVALDDDSDVAVSAVSEQTSGGDDDVRVLGYGEVTLDNGQNVTVQELDMNGQRVAVVDVDQDGVADLAMTDLNHNQQMDEGEVIDLHTGEAVSFTNDSNDDIAMASDSFDI